MSHDTTEKVIEGVVGAAQQLANQGGAHVGHAHHGAALVGSMAVSTASAIAPHAVARIAHATAVVFPPAAIALGVVSLAWWIKKEVFD